MNSVSGYFTVYVLDTNQQEQLCGSVSGPLDNSSSFMTSISCNGITGQKVIIRKNSNTPNNACWLLLCDVNVFATASKLVYNVTVSINNKTDYDMYLKYCRLL